MMEQTGQLSPDNIKYLRLLAKKFPTQQAVCTEIINLTAIQNLPKGTEYFMSDIHGEYDAFQHITNNCSGVIREKVQLALGNSIDEEELNSLCALIYYPKQRLEWLQAEGDLSYDWYKRILNELIQVARTASSKYTRSKVRKKLTADFAYIIDELMHMIPDEDGNQLRYHEKIIDTIITIKNGDAFIVTLAELIKSMAIDHLHLIGDMYDRGRKADYCMDLLMRFPEVDIQWGNHDVLWMGAAAGDPACIANVIRNNIRYQNSLILENGYGVSLRELFAFARKNYSGNAWEAANKACDVLTLKLEGQAILRHPEWKMDDRLMFQKVDFEKGTVRIGRKNVPLRTVEFPTIHPSDPYALSDDEEEVMKDLQYAFRHSQRLKRHMDFFDSHGSMYLVYNSNLLYHGCVPMDAKGEFYRFTIDGRKYQGKSLMDYCDQKIRDVCHGDHSEDSLDFMWYLWGGTHSPVCGRVLRTWERSFLEDQTYWKEEEDPYYTFNNRKGTCRKILQEFGVTSALAHIINGHTPIRAAEGESPIKAGGILLAIDGGFCEAYHEKTGIAGYTLLYNSHGMRIKSHGPFRDVASAIEGQTDIESTSQFFETEKKRQLVRDTDIGTSLEEQIRDLRDLLMAYRQGLIREKN